VHLSDFPATNRDGLITCSLHVSGICCPSEVPVIERLIGSMSSVDSVLVNVPKKMCYISYDPTSATTDDFLRVLNDAGLGASLVERGTSHGSTDEDKASKRYPRWNVMVAVVFWVLSMFSLLGGRAESLQWLALVSIVFTAKPVVMRALAAVRMGVLDIHCLMILSSVGAIAIGDYTEAGAVFTIFSLGGWLEDRTLESVNEAMKGIVDMQPSFARRVEGEEVSEIPVDEVIVGDILDIPAGVKVPVDGIVIQGEALIDQSMLTGESKPVAVHNDDKVHGGTVNSDGWVRIRATAEAKDSAMSKLVRLIEQAQAQKSPIEAQMEKFSKWYTPMTIAGAVAMATLPWMLDSENTNTNLEWTRRSLILLVTACPCALLVSTPIANACALSVGAKHGILIKGGKHIESASRLSIVAFDKTGTLTKGKFKIQHFNLLPQSKVPEEEIFSAIVAVETCSTHPVARALVVHSSSRRTSEQHRLQEVSDFKIIQGKGVSANYGQLQVFIGNCSSSSFELPHDWIGEHKEHIASFEQQVKGWEEGGGTTGWVMINGTPVACYCVADTLREGVEYTIAELQNLGMEPHLVTGDSRGAALSVANAVGIVDENVSWSLLPKDKIHTISQIKSQKLETIEGKTGNACSLFTGHCCIMKTFVAMVGDGINDAPALAAADLGISIGTRGAATTAMDSADIVLMDGDIRKTLWLVDLSKGVATTIYQNIVTAVGVKVIVLVLTFMGHATLWMAVAADVGSMIAASLNSTKLLKRKLGKDPESQTVSKSRSLDVSLGKVASLSIGTHAEEMKEEENSAFVMASFV